MTKTYAEQQEEVRRLSEASQNARVSFDIANHDLKAAQQREQSAFDAMLKDPDFQRWIREMWERHTKHEATCCVAPVGQHAPDCHTTHLRAAHEAQLEQEKTSVLAALKEPKTRTEAPKPTDRCSVSGCVNPPFLKHLTCFTHVEETTQKPPARAHLKGCVLDTTHGGDCLKYERQDPVTGNVVPTLSPRQALGEALACVERARDLLRTAATSPSSTQSGFEARVAAFRAYDDTQRAWANITSARALLVDGE